MANETTNNTYRDWKSPAVQEGWRLLQAKFAGRCCECGYAIAAGQWVQWNSNTKKVKHVDPTRDCGVAGQQRANRAEVACKSAETNRRAAESDRRDAARVAEEARAARQNAQVTEALRNALGDRVDEQTIEALRAIAVAPVAEAPRSEEAIKADIKAAWSAVCDLSLVKQQARERAGLVRSRRSLYTYDDYKAALRAADEAEATYNAANARFEAARAELKALTGEAK